jgi:hypothetical protein
MKRKSILYKSLFTMKGGKKYILVIPLLLFITIAFAQTNKKKTTKSNQQAKTDKQVKKDPVKPDLLNDERKVKDIVAFLEYVLNTIGSSATSVNDKDVLITESYTKIFRDSKVQIEDDLDNREVITNKDVPAYLKDVDFFFKDVKFELVVDNIEAEVNSGNTFFYKVSLKRNLRGTTADGQQVNNTVLRFIELNYNQKDQDLKIVSIYTHELDEKAALLNWWKDLSYEWQSVFQRKLNRGDSISLNDIVQAVAIEELDLSGNTYL